MSSTLATATTPFAKTIDALAANGIKHKDNDECILANEDCAKVLKIMPTSSVSVIIIDPPYGAQTQNQQHWDKAWSAEFWRAIMPDIFRVLIPAGHLVIFSSGMTTYQMNPKVEKAYIDSFKKTPSCYRLMWYHKSLDSGRPHNHIPRSQFEDMTVYFRTGQGKLMKDAGTIPSSYAFDNHVGRTNVFEFYKDDDHSKPWSAVQEFFATMKRKGKHCSTFDYKPEALMRALIRDFSSPGHTVLDFCMRHGITGVAALLERRRFIGVEMDSCSYDRAVSRISEQFRMQFDGGGSDLRVVPPSEYIAPPPPSPMHTSDADTASIDDVVMPTVAKSKHARPRGRAPHDKDGTKMAWNELLGKWERAATKSKTRQTPIQKKARTSIIEDKAKIVGSTVQIGTKRTYSVLHILKNIISIEGNEYFAAYADDETKRVKSMCIRNKDIQGIIGKIPKSILASYDIPD